MGDTVCLVCGGLSGCTPMTCAILYAFYNLKDNTEKELTVLPWTNNNDADDVLGTVLRPTLNFSFFFWPRPAACGILVPQPGIEPRPSAVKARSPNRWTAREFPEFT